MVASLYQLLCNIVAIHRTRERCGKMLYALQMRSMLVPVCRLVDEINGLFTRQRNGLSTKLTYSMTSGQSSMYLQLHLYTHTNKAHTSQSDSEPASQAAS